MTIQESITWARDALDKAGIDNAQQEAGWLVEAATGIPPTQFALARGTELSMEQDTELCAFISRRIRREPLQYILGEAPFFGRMFAVKPGVLIPREDTEVLCRLALEYAQPGQNALELCCGSGAVAISLVLDGKITVCAGDISPQAVELTRFNAQRFNAEVDARESDLFEGFAEQRFHLILCNPPYIPTNELPALMPEVRDYEPSLALDGGSDGLDFYRRVIPGSRMHLHPGGTLLLEIGHHQETAVRALMGEHGFTRVFCAPDLAGLPRVVGGSRAEGP